MICNISPTMRSAGKPVVPAGADVIEPLEHELPARSDMPAHKIRHPRNVRILPRSRDFH